MDEWKTRLRQAREAKGLNKTEFARLIGVSNPTVTDWEKATLDGGIRTLAGGNLTKVCTVLGIDARWLLTGEDSAPAARPVLNEDRLTYMLDPGLQPEARLIDLLSTKAESADELKMLIVYRSANERERQEIDAVIEEMRSLIEGRARDQAKRTG